MHPLSPGPHVAEVVRLRTGRDRRTWSWNGPNPLRTAGSFDYGNPAYVNQGIALWKRAAEVRVLRQRPMNIFMHRCNFELVALLYQLRAKVDCRQIYDEEIAASGWLP